METKFPIEYFMLLSTDFPMRKFVPGLDHRDIIPHYGEDRGVTLIKSLET